MINTKTRQPMNSISMNELDLIAQTLRAMGHPNRILIIMLLSKQKKMSVGELSERTGFAQPLVSHHVLDMHAKGILGLERDGRNAYYSLIDSRPIRMLRIASEIESCNKHSII